VNTRVEVKYQDLHGHINKTNISYCIIEYQYHENHDIQ